VYCSSAASNSGPFRPVSMLSQIFSDVSTLLAASYSRQPRVV
jgi:hypothetical protein